MDSFRAALDQFLDAASRDRGLSPATLNQYRKDLRLFAQWATLQNLAMSQVQQADVLEFLAYLLRHGHSAADVSRILARLGKFYAHQLSVGTLTTDPTDGVKPIA